MVKAKVMENEFLIKDYERDAIYKAIYLRRDVRGEFKPDPIPNDVIRRILTAAHHAPSVGFMQPWNFILVKSNKIRQKIKDSFNIAHENAAELFSDDKREKYRSFKLEGITDAPLGICVTCDRDRHGPVVIGRTSIPETDIYSTVCAIQNLWLAARSENIGVGWVSIIDNEQLKDILDIPQRVIPIAYLCIGYVTHFNNQPDLEKHGWLKRLDVDSLIFYDKWGGHY